MLEFTRKREKKRGRPEGEHEINIKLLLKFCSVRLTQELIGDFTNYVAANPRKLPPADGIL